VFKFSLEWKVLSKMDEAGVERYGGASQSEDLSLFVIMYLI
jgi:hypothetical protein